MWRYKDINYNILNENSDDLLEATIGNFGNWQLKTYLLMCILIFPIVWVELSVELLAHDTPWRCRTGIESKNLSLYDNKSFNMDAIKKEICLKASKSSPACPLGYEYDTSLTGPNIVTEWDLVCENEYLINIMQTLVMLGSVAGAAVFGIFSDKYGRRKCLIICCALRAVLGIISAFVTNFPLFVIISFFLSAFNMGVLSTTVIVCIEVLGGEWRTVLTILSQIPYGLGLPIMALVTYYTKNWRLTQIILFSSCLLTIVFAWLSSESPRWLFAVGRTDETVQVLQKAAKENKIEIDSISEVVNNFQDDNCDNTNPTFQISPLFKTPKLRKMTIVSCVLGLILNTLMCGLFQYFGQCSNNPFIDLTIQGFAVVVGTIISIIFVKKFNQRNTIAVTCILVGICLLVLVFISNTTIAYNIFIGIVYIGNGGITVAIMESYIGLLFPTSLRNSGYGLFSLFTSIGAMIAPLIIELLKNLHSTPTLTFAILSFLHGGTIFLLPDLKNTDFIQTLKEIEN